MEHEERIIFSPNDFFVSLNQRNKLLKINDKKFEKTNYFENENVFLEKNKDLELKIPGYSTIVKRIFQYTINDRLCVNQEMYEEIKKRNKDFSAILLENQENCLTNKLENQEDSLTNKFEKMFRTAEKEWKQISEKYLTKHLKKIRQKKNPRKTTKSKNGS